MERLSKSVVAKEIMTVNVFSIKKEDSLFQAADLMADHGISGLPVINSENHVVGIISENDFLFEMGEREKQSFMRVIVECLKNKGCTAISLRNRTVGDIMTSPPVTVREDTSIFEIASIFEEKKINRVPVTDKDARLSGIVTRFDIVLSYCMRIT